VGVLRRDHHDRDPAGVGVLLELAAGLVAVLHRHHDIEEDQRRPQLLGLGDRLVPVGGVRHAMPCARHHHTDQLAISLYVVNYENRVHALSFFRSQRRSAGIRNRSSSFTITGLASTASKPQVRRSGRRPTRASSTATIARSDSARSARSVWATAHTSATREVALTMTRHGWRWRATPTRSSMRSTAISSRDVVRR